jgi:formylglycine-generating enzyme required for sulfatase activity
LAFLGIRPLRALRACFRLLLSPLSLGILVGLAVAGGGWYGTQVTSTDEFCASCHVHPQATKSWKKSPHYDNDSGVFVHCVECHLPPGGLHYLTEKVRTGVRDAWTTWFGDPESIDWEERSLLEHARDFTYKDSCVGCHENLFPISLTEEGDEAHLHYEQHADELRCINCHLGVGHESRRESQRKKKAFELAGAGAGEAAELFTEAARPQAFEDFRETLPGTPVSFEMGAVPGGEFTIGSPASEPYREADEGPQRRVEVSRFWMGRVEVTWDEYMAFYQATRSEGRSDTRALSSTPDGVDAITGATPPYGDPDQGWGKGARPAITMTPHAAETYCRWLSQVTGKTYRLPTEAEWEYAARGGTDSAYFFEGSPKDFSERGFWNGLFGAETEGIVEHVVYAANSKGRTQPPEGVQPNPFGLVNMLGNVAELCADRYAPDAYAAWPEGEAVVDPRGPEEGDEFVVRGGFYASDAADLRCAAREPTQTEAWLKTDPQVPKSKWWYSDCTHVGFRVVCEVELDDAR